MKKCLMLVLAIGLALHGLCQSALQPVISPIRMNVIYRGIANPIAVAVPGYNWKDLRLEVDDVHRLECDDLGTWMAISLALLRFPSPLGYLEWRARNHPWLPSSHDALVFCNPRDVELNRLLANGPVQRV